MKGASRWLDAQAGPPMGAAAARRAKAKAVSFLSLDRMSVSFLGFLLLPRFRCPKGGEDLGDLACFDLGLSAAGLGDGEQRLAVHREQTPGQDLVERLARVLETSLHLIFGRELTDADADPLSGERAGAVDGTDGAAQHLTRARDGNARLLQGLE